MTPIKTMDFCTVVNRRKMKGSGLDLGTTVLVVSTKPLPEKKSDPYLQRIYVVVVRVTKDGDVLIPKEDNEYRSYIVDPRNLEKLSDEDTAKIKELVGERFSGDTP